MREMLQLVLDMFAGWNTGASTARWPGVSLAYDFVLPSYQWAQDRLDAVDSRIQTLQAFAASITAAAPILAAAIVKNIEFDSVWFALALVAFGLTVVTGAIARAWGSVTIVSPKHLYNHWLNFSEWDFKKNAIYFAGQHLETNRTLINRKAKVAGGMTVLFLLETVFLLVWVAREI